MNGKKETWQEAVNRVMDMHLKRYSGMVKPEDEAEFSKMFAHAYSLYSEQRVLGAQRALQYGGELMLEKHARFYNCSSTYVDRVRVIRGNHVSVTLWCWDRLQRSARSHG